MHAHPCLGAPCTACYTLLWAAFSFRDDGGVLSLFLTCSPGAFAIDLLLFKYLSGSFIYTALYLFRLMSMLRRSQPITYALLTRIVSVSCGYNLLLLFYFFPSSNLSFLTITPPTTSLLPLFVFILNIYFLLHIYNSLIVFLSLLSSIFFHCAGFGHV